jgi:2-hydroxychromene-2-carboxylate isomerase
MTLSVDLFFSFRSPYSYLALPKTTRLVADYDATVNLRPVYPLAVRVPGFFKRANPQFARYVVLDSSRVAKHENIPFRFPRPDRSGHGDAGGRRTPALHPPADAPWRRRAA